MLGRFNTKYLSTVAEQTLCAPHTFGQPFTERFASAAFGPLRRLSGETLGHARVRQDLLRCTCFRILKGHNLIRK